MKQKLTKSLLDKITPGSEIWDTEVKGFGVRYQKRYKVFCLKTRINGKQRWFSIGPFGSPWTVETARDEARSLLGKKADGASVHDLRNEKKTIPTVNELADMYLDRHAKPHKKAGSVENDIANLTNHIRPKMGELLVTEVDQTAIQKILQEIASGKIASNPKGSKQGNRGGALARGGKGVSNRCRSLLSKMFNLAETWGLIPKNTNPVRHTPKFKENAKERYLSTEEVEKLSDQLDIEAKERPYHVAAYRLLMLTGARKDEILSLKWDYVDIQRGLIFLPDSKTGKKQIHLSNAATDVLNSIPRIDKNPYVIASRIDNKHVVNLGKHWREMMKTLGMEGVRIHDLRHTFASTAIMEGIPLAVVGKMLGHKNHRTTERYAHIAQDQLKLASEAVSKKISQAKQPKAITAQAASEKIADKLAG